MTLERIMDLKMIEDQHGEYLKHLIDLLPIIHDVKQRFIVLNEERCEQIKYQIHSSEMWLEHYKEIIKQIAGEFNITEDDAGVILIGNPFNTLVKENILTSEELDRLW